MQKAFVRIYCKIFCDEFPDDGFAEGKLATGDEIHAFLSKELGFAIDPDTDEPLPGDFSLFYLATNEKFGVLAVNEIYLRWGFGESNWDRVLLFLRELSDRSIISIPQYIHLIGLVEEGMNSFDDYFLIPAYLKAKRDKLPWTKKQTDTKENMKKIIGDLKETMEAKGYKVLISGSSTQQQSFNE